MNADGPENMEHYVGLTIAHLYSIETAVRLGPLKSRGQRRKNYFSGYIIESENADTLSTQESLFHSSYSCYIGII